MFVVIAGGGRTGAQLAHYLINENHKVHLIENRKEVLSRIHKELPTEIIFEGNPLDPDVLETTGLRHAQVFAATMTADEANLAMCYYAREIFKVPRTIARVNNPRNAWLLIQNSMWMWQSIRQISSRVLLRKRCLWVT